MTINFPPHARTTTLAEAERLAKLAGLSSTATREVIRTELNDRVAKNTHRLDYVNFGGDNQTIGHACIITNDWGDEQFWLGLNVGHPFIQYILEDDVTKEQRTGIEIMLFTILSPMQSADQDEVTFWKREAVEWGRRLAVAIPILESIFWPDGRPEKDFDDEDYAEDDAEVEALSSEMLGQ